MLEIEMQGVDGGREPQTRAWWRTPQQAITAVVPRAALAEGTGRSG